MSGVDPSLSEFRGYFKAKEPGKRERAEAWATSIGLQKVDVSRVVRKSGKKKAVRKSGKKTVERVWELLRDQPQLTFAGMVAALGITRSTIQKHIASLKAAGRLRRIGPDKGGHWEVDQ